MKTLIDANFSKLRRGTRTFNLLYMFISERMRNIHRELIEVMLVQLLFEEQHDHKDG